MSTAITTEPPAFPTAPPPEFGPVAKVDRLVNLDFTRGMALLGILLVNATVFFGPLAALTDPSYHAALSPADRVTSLVGLTLWQGKFMTIFSMLFGYGLLGQFERADAAGRGAVGFAFRRLLPLMLFGLIHGLAVWFGDILFFYSVMGFWLLLARRARARTLVAVGLALVLFSVALAVGLAGLGTLAVGAAAERPRAPDTGLRGWSAVEASRGDPTSPAWIAGETAAYRDGPWADAQVFRTLEWVANVVFMLLCFGWLSLGMMFLGGALWRVKFFAPEQRRLRLRVLAVCLPTGLAIEAIAAWLLWPYPPPNPRDMLVGQVMQEAGLLFLPLGYLALFAVLGETLPDWLRGPVASAGRMSLTVYLSESFVATALAYHWGFRLFGRVGAFHQALVALAIWLTLVVLSHLWLQRFRQGPMEWLWRRLEYGRAAARMSEPHG
ncbi:MAG: DUF418 domain-containing protein [Gemmataceae bacterium]